MALMQVASLVIYFISIMLLHEYFDLRYVDLQFVLKVCLITVVSWLPFQVMYCLINIFDPSENTKIMNASKQYYE